MDSEMRLTELSALSSNPDGLIRPHHPKLMALVRALDGAVILYVLYFSTFFFGQTESVIYVWPAVLAVLLYIFFAEYFEVYSLWRGSRFTREALRITGAWLCTIGVLALVLVGFKLTGHYSRPVLVVWFVTAPLIIIAMLGLRRSFLAYVRKQGGNSRTYAVAAANKMGKRISDGINQMDWLGYRFAGYYDDRSFSEDRRLVQGGNAIPVEGPFDQLISDVKTGKIDHVYITLPMRAEKRIQKLIRELADSTASVYIVPDFNAFDPLRARWQTLQGMPIVSVYDTPFSIFDGFLKRLEDLVLGAAILTLIAVPMLFIAAGVKLSSPGPIIFKQRRYGVAGQEIEVWKFRSMTVCENGPTIKQATKNDARVTPFGRFIRRTSLDELPQFINVLQGRMSIVGPRPHAVAHNEYYRDKVHGYMLRHVVKPGITGLAQINGCRGETDTDEKMRERVRYDLQYIKHWSLWLDLKVVLLTVFKGFRSSGVY